MQEPIIEVVNEPRRRRISWGWRVLIAGALLFVLWAVLAPRLFRPTGLQEVEMPDGTILTLQAVTFGDHHEFDVNRLLRATHYAWRTERAITQDMPPYTTGLWFTRRNKQSGEPLAFPFWSHATAVDDQGYETADYDQITSVNGFAGSGFTGKRSWGSRGGGRPLSDPDDKDALAIVASTFVRPFRHQGNTFKFRIYNTNNEVVAEFDVPRQDHRELPDWKPDTLPVSRTNGDLKVTLESLPIKIETWGSTNGRPNVATEPEATFSIFEGNSPTTRWEDPELVFIDAAGNRCTSPHIELNPNDPAWKVEASFYRRKSTTFSDSELWKIAQIPVPTEARINIAPLSSVVDGVTISLDRIGPAGQTVYEDLLPARDSGHNGGYAEASSFPDEGRFEIHHEYKSGRSWLTIDATRPHLVARIAELPPDIHVDIRVKDDQGRPVSAVVPRMNEGLSIYFLDVPPGAKSLEVTFIVQRSRKFEFYIKPPFTAEQWKAELEKGAAEWGERE